jgi:anti-sigma B factor antagonist
VANSRTPANIGAADGSSIQSTPGAGGFSITMARTKDCLVAIITGEIDAITIPAVERELGSQPTDDTNALIIDLSRVDFCSCGGMQILFDLLTRANSRAVPLSLVVETHAVRRCLEVLDPTHRFNVRFDRDTALESLTL